MNEIETIKQKIKLKKQAVPIIKSEIIDLQAKLCLHFLKGYYESQQDDGDPSIHRKLDCVFSMLDG